MYISYMILDRSAWMSGVSFLLFPVLLICFHIIRKYLSNTKLSVVTHLTLRHTKAATKLSS